MIAGSPRAMSRKLFDDLGLPATSIASDRFAPCGNPDMIRGPRTLLPDGGCGEGHGEPGPFVVEKALVET